MPGGMSRLGIDRAKREQLRLSVMQGEKGGAGGGGG